MCYCCVVVCSAVTELLLRNVGWHTNVGVIQVTVLRITSLELLNYMKRHETNKCFNKFIYTHRHNIDRDTKGIIQGVP